jgi:ABC-type antimicrobial peptide transport system permease subunit
LAALGLYGVIAWAVAQRKREIGIRMALGANPGDVMRMVLREVFWLAAGGFAVAVPLWAASARLTRSLLFAVTSYDPMTMAAAVLVLGMVAGAAGLIPAFRAARIDPNLAIRYE